MKYYLDRKGNAHSEYSLTQAIYLITGVEYGCDEITTQIFRHLPMIVREVKPEEWRVIAPINKVAAARLYREINDCSIRNAVDEVERFLEEKRIWEGGR